MRARYIMMTAGTLAAFAVAFVLVSWKRSSALQLYAEPALAEGATIIRFFDDPWSKDPERVWCLEYPVQATRELVASYYYFT